jgi:hypothetical protein
MEVTLNYHFNFGKYLSLSSANALLSGSLKRHVFANAKKVTL